MLPTQASSTPAPTVPEDAPSQEAPKHETKKALTDFFEAIETEQTTIFNPQGGRCAHFLFLRFRVSPAVSSPAPGQFQPATYNPFNAAGTPGPSTNPFPQIQPQPTAFLQPQATAVPGVVQQSSNPFPAAPPNFLQAHMPGANPFRASTLPMQATGLSPFAQTSPIQPAPTGFNPFVSQNGSLGMDPFPNRNLGTNPFPSAVPTTNPFPTAGNSFTAPTNNPAPNFAGSNPFSSMNSNPFPVTSQIAPQPFSFASPSQPNALTSNSAASPTFSVPARPASTPLTHTKTSSPPPMPLKPHQTGSRNPFGVPKAPSPPPVPRAPTLFELATGVAQPQQLAQSPVQVKPQATGLPSTTFTGVASSFITGGTGGTGGAQAPQLMTSSLTSLGSPSTATSTPTSLSATGSTFSDPLFGSLGGQPTGSTALSSQPTGAPLRPQTTGYTAGLKTFKPTSSFGASLFEALPPIPQSEPTTPELASAATAASPPVGTTGTSGAGATVGAGFGPSFRSVSSPVIGGASGLGGSFGQATQPSGLPAAGAGTGGLTPFSAGGGGSSLGVGMRPQATGFGMGLGAANPFRASSVLAPGGIGSAGAGAGAGAFPGTSTALFSQPTGAPSFGQSLFMGAQTDASKQQSGAAQLI